MCICGCRNWFVKLYHKTSLIYFAVSLLFGNYDKIWDFSASVQQHRSINVDCCRFIVAFHTNFFLGGLLSTEQSDVTEFQMPVFKNKFTPKQTLLKLGPDVLIQTGPSSKQLYRMDARPCINFEDLSSFGRQQLSDPQILKNPLSSRVNWRRKIARCKMTTYQIGKSLLLYFKYQC